ncbi:hypothetical protein ACEWY4_020757 [Coilia grayii]|uniref:Uncharacterized protein n=1 Tax=Coilia grayii TaxID=363190 RepID=A0ABD1J717_9TELE
MAVDGLCCTVVVGWGPGRPGTDGWLWTDCAALIHGSLFPAEDACVQAFLLRRPGDITQGRFSSLRLPGDEINCAVSDASPLPPFRLRPPEPVTAATAADKCRHLSGAPFTDRQPKALAQTSLGSVRRKEQSSSSSPVFPGVAPACDPDDLAQKRQHKALQDQHHLAVYWSLYRLRDEMADRYTALLREKVQRQRRDIRQREKNFIQTHSKRTKKKKRRQESQKLARSTLSRDDTHMRSLPKTTHYLILELQRQLVQQGCLKSRPEQEQFNQWLNQVPRGTKLRRRLQEMVILSKSAPNLRFEGLLKRKPQLPEIQVSSHGNGPQEDTAPDEEVEEEGEEEEEEEEEEEGEEEEEEEEGLGRRGDGPSGRSSADPGDKQQQERDGAKQMFPKASVKPQGQQGCLLP